MGLSFEYKVDIDGFFNRAVARKQDEIDKAVDSAVEELFAELKTEFANIYKTVIDEFYNEYTGSGKTAGGDVGLFYSRNGSLYNLLEMSENKDIIAWAFYPDRATSLERAQGTVYQLAFLEGWHGGAAGTDKHQETVDTPHWRTPFPRSPRDDDDDDKGPGGYFYWGAEAAQSDPSPYEKWEERRKEYVRDNGRTKFISLLQKHIDNIRWF